MSNLDITFDDAYEYGTYKYSAFDGKNTYHHIKNDDVGLRINPGNDGAMFYEGTNPKAQDFFYSINCNLNVIDRSDSSVTAHFQCSDHNLKVNKSTIQNGDACNRSNVCLNEMKSLHFRFK
ncbi:MAG: hypothetical protein sL5_00790 [Candidatus Mesenet longicola]|uniref:Uncharacterized protein n=1 Tax=Candidatus Mesenet longicola TaxID=1892558 RepID=A0A8J3HWV8_9RICK|nr:MAG: hypothetical protein sGL2_00170 [Candidatus Mesenet longicola]GHM59086.1 MAG: hypothetical protein sL5_00790 [Candidatus Mesenet longicola]